MLMKCGIIDTKPQLLFPYKDLNSRISNRELGLYGFLLEFTMRKLWGPPQEWNIRCQNKPNPGNRFPVHTSVTVDCVEALLFHCASEAEVIKAERYHIHVTEWLAERYTWFICVRSRVWIATRNVSLSIPTDKEWKWVVTMHLVDSMWRWNVKVYLNLLVPSPCRNSCEVCIRVLSYS